MIVFCLAKTRPWSMGLQRTLRARAFIGVGHGNGLERKGVKRNKNGGKTKLMCNVS